MTLHPAIVKRFISERSQAGPRHTRFVGPAAALMGIALVCMSLGVGAAGAAFLTGREEDLYAYAIARPGLPLLFAGVACGTIGASRVIGAREWRGSRRRVIANIPERLGGLFVLMIGLAAAGLGAFEIVAPMAFDAALDSLLAPLANAPQ